MMSFTVVPLHNLALPSKVVIPFGKFTIQDVPDWLLKEPILHHLSTHDRDSVHSASMPSCPNISLIPSDIPS